MRCPQCSSEQIQRDIDTGSAFSRLAGRRQLLCMTCGHTFSAFDPFGKLGRDSAKRDTNSGNRRRSHRFGVHLSASISLVQGNPKEGKATYSEASQGHCDIINEHGMGISLVGSKFTEADMTQVGGFLLVRVRLPEATIKAVVSIVNHKRIGENQKRKWFLGVKFQQMPDEDKERLSDFLTQRERNQPLIVSD